MASISGRVPPPPNDFVGPPPQMNCPPLTVSHRRWQQDCDDPRTGTKGRQDCYQTITVSAVPQYVYVHERGGYAWRCMSTSTSGPIMCYDCMAPGDPGLDRFPGSPGDDPSGPVIG